MTVKTRRQLVDRAGEALGVLAAGQSLATEDVARIDGYVEPTLEDLTARDVIYIPDSEEFDYAIFDDLALCLANNCRHAFGLGGNAELPAAVKGPLGAENSLRIKSVGKPTYKPLKTVYY